MKVFRLQLDLDYQYFLVANENDVMSLKLACRPRLVDWEPPEVFIYEPLLKPGDLWNFGGDPIFSPRATECLCTHLEKAGELLPLPYEGQTYTLLNVLACVDCLDYENVVWYDPPNPDIEWVGWIDSYAFHPDRFGESDIFKIPETQGGEVLVLDREKPDSNNSFVDALRRYNIIGYRLDLLWTYSS